MLFMTFYAIRGNYRRSPIGKAIIHHSVTCCQIALFFNDFSIFWLEHKLILVLKHAKIYIIKNQKCAFFD